MSDEEDTKGSDSDDEGEGHMLGTEDWEVYDRCEVFTDTVQVISKDVRGLMFCQRCLDTGHHTEERYTVFVTGIPADSVEEDLHVIFQV